MFHLRLTLKILKNWGEDEDSIFEADCESHEVYYMEGIKVF